MIWMYSLVSRKVSFLPSVDPVQRLALSNQPKPLFALHLGKIHCSNPADALCHTRHINFYNVPRIYFPTVPPIALIRTSQKSFTLAYSKQIQTLWSFNKRGIVLPTRKQRD